MKSKKLAFVSLLLVVQVLLSCGCSRTNVNVNTNVRLKYYVNETQTDVILTKEEAASVIEILDDQEYFSFLSGVPGCGFDKNVSLQVGNRVYAVACDKCNVVQDLGNLRFFDIPQKDMEYIHSLFEKYGGHFPCI